MVTIGILTISDRASRGEYEDLSGPAIEAWLKLAISSPWQAKRRIVADGVEQVKDALIDLCDRDRVDLVLTTGGTGPAPRDLTPEAMAGVLDKELPGFGEVMRRISFETVPGRVPGRGVTEVSSRSAARHYERPSERAAGWSSTDFR